MGNFHLDGMDALYHAGIKGKLYRLWFELNQSSIIQIKSGVGMTNTKLIEENVAQGSIGGGILSALNLDDGIHNFFQGSSWYSNEGDK